MLFQVTIRGGVGYCAGRELAGCGGHPYYVSEEVNLILGGSSGGSSGGSGGGDPVCSLDGDGNNLINVQGGWSVAIAICICEALDTLPTQIC